MTSTLLRRFGPLLLGGAVALGLTAAAKSEELRIGYRGADHRHLRPGRQGHGRWLQDVSRRTEEQVRRRRREVHRRGRAGQAGHRRHQGQEAHPAGQGAHVRRRPAGVDAATRWRRSAPPRRSVYVVAGRRGGRSDPARPAEISVYHPHRLVAARSRAIRSDNGPATRATRRSSPSAPTMLSATRSSAASSARSRPAAGRSSRRSGRRSAPRTSGRTSRP